MFVAHRKHAVAIAILCPPSNDHRHYTNAAVGDGGMLNALDTCRFKTAAVFVLRFTTLVQMHIPFFHLQLGLICVY